MRPRWQNFKRSDEFCTTTSLYYDVKVHLWHVLSISNSIMSIFPEPLLQAGRHQLVGLRAALIALAPAASAPLAVVRADTARLLLHVDTRGFGLSAPPPLAHAPADCNRFFCRGSGSS